ncbi:hypothetical protein KAK07_06290 [Ideonella sp. 4Y16]|uniref:hypothetical protein n=1 Tax=Ideonella alba TaxID=2824118 RepID=UPI001B399751|nr:hypothetical protein [Ideonella alba]MBQ0942937.1 hypothetical protein [Ideonella alba]
MTPPTTTPPHPERHTEAPTRWASWSPLLVLGGSAVTATLLIQLGLSALGPASAFMEGAQAAAPHPPAPLDTQVAVADASRGR